VITDEGFYDSEDEFGVSKPVFNISIFMIFSTIKMSN